MAARQGETVEGEVRRVKDIKHLHVVSGVGIVEDVCDRRTHIVRGHRIVTQRVTADGHIGEVVTIQIPVHDQILHDDERPLRQVNDVVLTRDEDRRVKEDLGRVGIAIGQLKRFPDGGDPVKGIENVGQSVHDQPRVGPKGHRRATLQLKRTRVDHPAIVDSSAVNGAALTCGISRCQTPRKAVADIECRIAVTVQKRNGRQQPTVIGRLARDHIIGGVERAIDARQCHCAGKDLGRIPTDDIATKVRKALGHLNVSIGVRVAEDNTVLNGDRQIETEVVDPTPFKVGRISGDRRILDVERALVLDGPAATEGEKGLVVGDGGIHQIETPIVEYAAPRPV